MIKRLGQKIRSFGSRIGTKLSEGIGNLGRKLYENRYSILQGLSSAAIVGGGLYVGSQNKYLQNVLASQRENINNIRDVRNTYSSLPNDAERAGFKEQMSDMGVPSQVFFGA